LGGSEGVVGIRFTKDGREDAQKKKRLVWELRPSERKKNQRHHDRENTPEKPLPLPRKDKNSRGGGGETSLVTHWTGEGKHFKKKGEKQVLLYSILRSDQKQVTSPERTLPATTRCEKAGAPRMHN